jgi:hypothetical protein
VDQIPVEASFSAHAQTGPRVHVTSFVMGTGSFPEISGRDVALNTHSHLAPRLKKEYSYISIPFMGLRGTLQGEFYLYITNTVLS